MNTGVVLAVDRPEAVTVVESSLADEVDALRSTRDPEHLDVIANAADRTDTIITNMLQLAGKATPAAPGSK